MLYSFSGLVLLFLIAFTGIRNHSRTVESIDISIAQEEGNFFTDQLEVMDLMTLDKADYIVGVEVDEISPKILEKRVEENPFVKEAQVYRDLKGNLRVKVRQSKPIARVPLDELDRYIDSEGNVLPVNAKHTARVPLLETTFEFGWEESLMESGYGAQLFELLTFIERDEFWKAQIAHIIVEENGEVILLPQVTKQAVHLGKPEDLEKKFKKLMIFYKEILPNKGWNTYSMVNLKYENQIICE